MVSIFILKLLLIVIFTGWVSLWVLKPTEVWTRKWKGAEEKATDSVFGYNGLDFAVYTFPLIALAIIGFIYMTLKQRASRSRPKTSRITTLSNLLIVNRYTSILSSTEILASSLFLIFLAWTFYTRISNDFKKMVPIKSFKLSLWQYKLFRMATRCGLLAEACLALLLLPVLRGMSIFRLLGIQFEASVRYHTWLGTAMTFFATLHGAGTFFIWGLKHRIGDEMWKWQKTGRIYLAGEMALLSGLVIFITALPWIRRKCFELFYYTHHLYIVFLVFFLLHGGDRHFYMVLPGVFLFALDKVLRMIQSKPETCILSARVFPCKAVELTLPKDPSLRYMPISVIFVKIPSISKYQWHPFSITSSSSIEEHTMSIIIKSEGGWTSSVYDKIQAEIDIEAHQRNSIPIAVEGPYGPASLHFLRYDNLILVAGGIGITPFLSILQELGCYRSDGRDGCPGRIQLIFSVKQSHDISLLNPILPQLLDVEKSRIELKAYVTQEIQSAATLTEILDDSFHQRQINFSTGCTSYAAYGTVNITLQAAIAMLSSIIFLAFLSCFSHFILPPSKKPSKEKHSSSIDDVLLICSFAVAITFCTFVAFILRRKRIRKGLPSPCDEKGNATKLVSIEANRSLEEHETHYGGRPNFEDIFSAFANDCGDSNIGVLVCGPDTMKESVASACKLCSPTLGISSQKKKLHFSFHSLNFAL